MVEWLRRLTSNLKILVRILTGATCPIGIWSGIGGNAVDSLLKLELYSFIVRSFPKWSWFRAFPWPSLRHFWDSYRDTLTERNVTKSKWYLNPFFKPKFLLHDRAPISQIVPRKWTQHFHPINEAEAQPWVSENLSSCVNWNLQYRLAVCGRG